MKIIPWIIKNGGINIRRDNKPVLKESIDELRNALSLLEESSKAGNQPFVLKCLRSVRLQALYAESIIRNGGK